MDDSHSISVEGVSKKYCKSLRRSMLYGLTDLSRNAMGMRSNSEELRTDEFWAVSDVSFSVERGDSIGLIGPNGSGKTTLLKMINGIFWPDRGRIQVRGRVGALIAVGAGFHPLLTGRENIFVNGAILGMGKAEVEKNFDAIVEFAEVGDFIDTPVKHYSSGMFVRLGFAVAAHSDPDIMLVDEVLAVGDRGFQTRCFKKMGDLRDGGTTFVVVSHNMHTVAGFCDWVALVNKGNMTRYDRVFEGIRAYTRLFLGAGEEAIERLVSRGNHVEFDAVELSAREFAPGDDFSITMRYVASQAYEDVEVDVAIYDARDPEFYFQATNQAYDRRIDLEAGEGRFTLRLKNLQMNGTMGTVAVAIWAKDRAEQLFWWRIPVEVSGVDHATGKNFVPVEFEVTR